ncbi:hypothetical protein [Flavobacterium frigoris]|uniref:Lipoprotein n=1 Tax=Flavobacterium frigoris TaxID=229204 RepID=A0A1H9SBZ3_FLAFI|nr:hypothetical protein [Flavobacterium frigoris]SER82507.1 hypothetical protein SAMN05444355_1612 [Flavobacterium frigoris]
MSNQGIKIVFLIVPFLLFSCKKELTEEQKKEELIKKREQYFYSSKKLTGDKEYFSIYKKANDTIANWVTNGLEISIIKPFLLDSLLCFNQQKNRFYGVVFQQTIRKGAVQDYIVDFYGVKIKGEWYFFRGSTLVLPREYYQEDIHTPLSLEKMKQIAVQNVFSGYLIETPSATNSNKVKYKINDSKFINMENRNNDGTFASCYNCKTFDEFVIYRVNKNWKERIESSHIAPTPSPFRVVE